MKFNFDNTLFISQERNMENANSCHFYYLERLPYTLMFYKNIMAINTNKTHTHVHTQTTNTKQVIVVSKQDMLPWCNLESSKWPQAIRYLINTLQSLLSHKKEKGLVNL